MALQRTLDEVAKQGSHRSCIADITLPQKRPFLPNELRFRYEIRSSFAKQTSAFPNHPGEGGVRQPGRTHRTCC